MPVMIKPHYRGRQLKRGGGGGDRGGWLWWGRGAVQGLADSLSLGEGEQAAAATSVVPSTSRAVASRSLPRGVGRARA